MSEPANEKDPVIADYIEAYETCHGKSPDIVRAGSWYRIAGSTTVRKSKLPAMADRLRKMAQNKEG